MDKENLIVVKKLQSIAELKQLIKVFSLAFEEEYKVEDDYLEKILNNDTIVTLGIKNKREIIGGLMAFEMTPIHGSKEFYIYDIAVHPDFQKQGMGKKLIEHIKSEGKKRDIKTIFVEAESEDVGAVAFYKAIGGQEVKVNHFNFTIK